MDSLRSYILSIVAGAIVCGIVIKLLGEKGTQGAMAKLMAGLFLTFTVIRPIADIRLDKMGDIMDIYTADAMTAVEAGSQITRDALIQSIKAQCEAYILDKAEDLGLTLQVAVTLSEDEMPVPIGVTLSGAAAPYAKGRLSAILSEELGIEKEAQKWI